MKSRKLNFKKKIYENVFQRQKTTSKDQTTKDILNRLKKNKEPLKNKIVLCFESFQNPFHYCFIQPYQFVGKIKNIKGIYFEKILIKEITGKKMNEKKILFLQKKIKMKTKKLKKYQIFLQEKVLILSEGKNSYEKAIKYYKKLEKDCRESYINRMEQVQEETQERIKSLVLLRSQIKVLGPILNNLKKIHDIQNNLIIYRLYLKQFSERVKKGENFVFELKKIRKLFKKDDFIQTILLQFTESVSEKGLLTLKQLKKHYQYVNKKFQVNRFLSQIKFLFSNYSNLFLVMLKDPEFKQKDEIKNILTSIGFYIDQHDIEKALKEIQNLPDNFIQNNIKWKIHLERRLACIQTLDILETYLLVQIEECSTSIN